MKDKVKKILYMIIIGVAVLGFSYIYAHIDKNTYIYDRNVDAGLYYGTGILENDKTVEQVFTSDEDVIEGINLKVGIFGNAENVVLHYALTDMQTGERYAASVPANQIENNKINKLETPKIAQAKGKQYTLTLSSENADEQNGVGFYVVPGKVEDQQLTVRDGGVDGVLVVRLLCHRFDVETFVVLLGIILFVAIFMKKLYKSFS